MVAAAVIGAAAIGAVVTNVAANKASGATQGAADTATAEQQWAMQQEMGMSAPYRAAGELALPQLENLLGLGTGGTAGIESTLKNMPGYQFTQQQGNQGTINAATATGMNLSGNTLQSLSQFNTGLADQTYNQYVGQLENLSGMGQAAAAGQAQATQAGANNIGNIATAQGQNQANIAIGEAGAYSNILGGAASNYASYENNQNLLASLGGGGGGGGYNTAPNPNITVPEGP